MRDRYPATAEVITANANSNDPLLGINTKLGFRSHRTSVYYQVSRQKLAEGAAPT